MRENLWRSLFVALLCVPAAWRSVTWAEVVRSSVVEELLGQAAEAETEEGQDELAAGLTEFGMEALPVLIEHLSLYQNRQQIVLEKGIVGLGEEAVAPLIEAIAGNYWIIQRGIETTLVRYGERAVPRLLIALARSEDSTTRSMAARALGSIGDERATEALIRTSIRDRRWSARRSAAEALGSIGGRRATRALIEALGDRDPEVRRAAVQGLGRIAIELGSDTLAAPYEIVSRRAVLEQAVIPLVHRLEDESYGVRTSAAKALGEMGGAAVGPLSEVARGDDLAAAGLAIMALGEIGDGRATDLLVEMLGRREWALRAWAADALGSMGGKDLGGALRAAHVDETHPLVRSRIERALETIDQQGE